MNNALVNGETRWDCLISEFEAEAEKTETLVWESGGERGIVYFPNLTRRKKTETLRFGEWWRKGDILFSEFREQTEYVPAILGNLVGRWAPSVMNVFVEKSYLLRLFIARIRAFRPRQLPRPLANGGVATAYSPRPAGGLQRTGQYPFVG